MIIIPEKNAVALALREPERVTTLIPHAKTIEVQGRELVVVKHGLDETKLLRNLGIKVPSPIRHHYAWSGSYTPFEAQRVTAEFLTLCNRAYVLNDIGTGKSLSTLWAYDYLHRIGNVDSVLIVAPLSTIELTWGSEIFRHFPHLDYQVLHGDRAKRLRLLDQDADVYIVNHDGVKIIKDALKDRDDINLVVVDELTQVARNSGTDRWHALNAVINKQKPRKAWGLTGAPIPNSPFDAWAQCRLLTPETVPAYSNKFRDMVMRQLGPYRWEPRDNAVDTVNEVMRPAVRFSRDDCIDLPPVMYETRSVAMTPDQARAYKEMLNKMRTEADNNEILAVNEAVKAGKLVQIACIAYNTDVLTDRGWVPIQDVGESDLVWDGEEWVAQGGAVYKGFRPVVSVNGVRMTEDHKVWVGEWVEAKEIINGNAREKFGRTEVRLPSSVGAGRHQQIGDGNLVVPVRLREQSRPCEPVPSGEAPRASAQLRMPPRQRNAQNDEHADLRRVDQHEAPLLESVRQGLAELWRTRYQYMRALAGLVREFLRGYGRRVREGIDPRAGEQRWPVLPGELRMGDTNAAEQQSAKQQVHRYSKGAYDGGGGRESVRIEKGDTGGASGEVQVASTAGADRTYDLIDCGPRNRFVVRGETGTPVIVHNCGVAYSTTGDEVSIPATPRLNVVNEIVDACAHKVIVFVPFVSAVNHVAKFLRDQGHTTECIHGGVSRSERETIFRAFQNGSDPKVLVAQPAAMSHGLTLTAASTIIWYAPVNSNDTFVQANGRITRPGQKNDQFIIMIEGSSIERRMYERLKNRQQMQGVLLDLVRAEAS